MVVERVTDSGEDDLDRDLERYRWLLCLQNRCNERGMLSEVQRITASTV
jgi:hypothetical protein